MSQDRSRENRGIRVPSRKVSAESKLTEESVGEVFVCILMMLTDLESVQVGGLL